MKQIGAFIPRIVEACGRHPLLTGILAIIGLFGTLFGVYDSFLSRSENANSAQQAAETQQYASEANEGIKQVDRSLADLDRKVEEVGKLVTLPPLIQSTNINEVPAMDFAYLSDKPEVRRFVDFIRENQNGIVEIDIAFRNDEITDLRTSHYLRLSDFQNDEENDFVCFDIFFEKTNALGGYMGRDIGSNGSTNVKGYFLLSSVKQSNAAASGCMAFEVNLLALSVADETTYVR